MRIHHRAPVAITINVTPARHTEAPLNTIGGRPVSPLLLRHSGCSSPAALCSAALAWSGLAFTAALAFQTLSAVIGAATAAGAVLLLSAFGAFIAAATVSLFRCFWEHGGIVRFVGPVAAFSSALVFGTLGPSSERVIGPNDEAVYANAAAMVARSGALRAHPAFLSGLPDADRAPLLRSIPVQAQRSQDRAPGRMSWEPGFPVRDLAAASVSPVFPPAWPVFLGSAVRILGWDAGRSANAFLVFASGIVLALLAASWLGPWPAVLAAPLVWLFPLHALASRSLYAEPLLLLLWCTALLAIAMDPPRETRTLSARSPVPRILAVVAFGLCPFVKLEGALLIPPALFAIALSSPRLQTALKIASITAVAAAGSLAITLLLAGPYARDTFAAWVNPEAACALAGASVLALAAFFAIRAFRFSGKPACLAALTAALAIAAAYCYFLRPFQPQPDSFFYVPAGGVIRSFREESLVRLGWYFGPPALAAAIIGFFALAWRTRTAWHSVLFGTALLFFALLVFDLRNSPAQPYAMRRLVTCVTPALCLGLASLASFPCPWHPRLVRALGIAFAGLPLLAFLPLDRRLCSQSNHSGLIRQVAGLADLIPDNALVVASSSSPLAALSPALQFMHGKHVYVCPANLDLNGKRALDRALSAWRAHRGPVLALRDAIALPRGFGRPPSGFIETVALRDSLLRIPDTTSRISLAFSLEHFDPAPHRPADPSNPRL